MIGSCFPRSLTAVWERDKKVAAVKQRLTEGGRVQNRDEGGLELNGKSGEKQTAFKIHFGRRSAKT